MSGFPSRETIEATRRRFPVGMRVELVKMNDPYTCLKPGDQGTVSYVDDIATVFVNWDNGSRLGAAYGEDIIKRVEEAAV